MASKTCGFCLRTALRPRGSISITLRHTSKSTSTRTITSSSRRLVAAADTPLGSTSQHFRESAAAAAAPAAHEQKTSATAIHTPKADVEKIQGGTLDTYAAYGATEILYKECSNQAPYSIAKVEEGEEVPTLENGTQLGVGEGWWYQELGLQPTFTSWTQVTMLHMYLISARLRCFNPDACKTWQQQFIDHFFTDAENRMIVNHGIESRSARNGYLKDLFLQWRGILLSYDEGVVRGDAVLAAAVWRNLFNGDENVDLVKLAQVVAFMRKSLGVLEGMGDVELVSGGWGFGKPVDEGDFVRRKARLMEVPFESGPAGKVVGEAAKKKKKA